MDARETAEKILELPDGELGESPVFSLPYRVRDDGVWVASSDDLKSLARAYLDEELARISDDGC